MREVVGSRDLERRLSRSLRAEAPVAPLDLADRLLARTAAIDQRRRWTPWSMMMPALAAAAVIVLAVYVGLQLGGFLPRTGEGPFGSTEPSQSPVATESASPDPTGSAAPSPTPSVSPSPEAFPGGQTCESETLGVIVSYPADWFANEAVLPDDPALDPVEGCQYFSDEPMEIAPNAGLPPTVAIIFSRVAEEPPSSGSTISSEDVTVAGRLATVTESEGTGDGPFFAEGDFSYGYRITLADGEFLLASTHYANEGDYETHKQVLDRMMETLVLTGG
ncbi:MAG: hypothetical protein ACRDGD_09935 [Candidatus Limnocylindria bacterium]